MYDSVLFKILYRLLYSKVTQHSILPEESPVCDARAPLFLSFWVFLRHEVN